VTVIGYVLNIGFEAVVVDPCTIDGAVLAIFIAKATEVMAGFGRHLRRKLAAVDLVPGQAGNEIVPTEAKTLGKGESVFTSISKKGELSIFAELLCGFSGNVPVIGTTLEDIRYLLYIARKQIRIGTSYAQYKGAFPFFDGAIEHEFTGQQSNVPPSPQFSIAPFHHFYI